MIKNNLFIKLCRYVTTQTPISTKNTIISAISFTNSQKNDKALSLPLCDHVFIKNCDTDFIYKLLQNGKFPNLKYIGIDYKTNDYDKNNILCMIKHRSFTLIHYDNIKRFHMIYYDKNIKVGIKLD